MVLSFIRLLIDQLGEQGVLFEPGLSDDEVESVEDLYGFRFPPDLRKLLQYALPVSEGFPNWRRGPVAALRASLSWPVKGILFEVEHHNFWLPSWGNQPSAPGDALALAQRHLAAVPLLIPVYAHRYLPAEPRQAGNPVFAVAGTDVIYAGSDLASWFAADFGVPCPRWAVTTPHSIAFWDDLVA
jgi:hypothetical protein